MYLENYIKYKESNDRSFPKLLIGTCLGLSNSDYPFENMTIS
ncbi:unnamed protein product [Fusarium venenatum]|uniref:Uncharacterized protein n=1 Tax=Fusarium venenatum TaxID=56646 RepID=A0A2L2TCA5_9HYPO|nr:uncharacterized protein FVRRES_04220 [Fusarium venenatum]CEI67708.1 unnamed protein product [Fusarium venenatum]